MPTPAPEAAPRALARSLVRHASLLRQITARDIRQRYRGSALGLLWSFLTPFLLLAVYTFVFSVVFVPRWSAGVGGDATPRTSEFAIILFCGLLIHAFFAEVLARAPGIILGHASFVKKVVFPLEILPLAVIGSALFHFLAGLAVLVGGLLLTGGTLHATLLLLPLVLFPLVLLAAGVAWLLASVGVYLRDIGQVMGLASTLLLFLSPVFYPAEALPEVIRPLLLLNPLTVMIENARAIMLWGSWPDWRALGLYALVSLGIFFFGFWWFQKSRKGFADVM